MHTGSIESDRGMRMNECKNDVDQYTLAAVRKSRRKL